ncbi:MAG TPA: response regulator [Treponemataceae bacterium]|nr:response regulator [Treponemataceae bacterium]
MYSVFLVEDEIVVREGIRSSIAWEDTRFNLIGEAPDGEMALSMLQELKPDILLTDIKMPFMDGLALTRIIRKTQPWMKIVIISGHDEFQYAREAISLGVEEYLLKPVSADDMLKCLEKIADRIEDEKRESESLAALRKQAQSNTEAQREKWLASLVSGEVSAEKAIEIARVHEIDLIAKGYSVLIVEIDLPTEDFSQLERVRRILASYEVSSLEVIAFPQGVNQYVFIVKDTGEESLEERSYSLAQGLLFEVKRNSSCKILVGIGLPAERIAEIPRSFSEANAALRHIVASGTKEIVGFSDMEAEDIAGSRSGSDPVADRLRVLSSGDIECFVAQYEKMLGKNENQSSYIGYYLLYDLVVAATTVVRELGGNYTELFPSARNHDLLIDMASDRRTFTAEIRRILHAILALQNAMPVDPHLSMIKKAKIYIDSHFSDSDISLHVVASEVNVSPNHFSTIFSQEAGETFIEYLTCVRIEHAKRLLKTTRMKSADIAYESGFNDPHYFSFMFKKKTGISPREFRAVKNQSTE